MRKIDKTKILSTQYRQWLDKLNDDQVKHPGSRIYYYDVVMNLLYCQKGVCAYTEIALCNPGLLSEDRWENGRYTLEKPEPFGELEHFNPQLKKDKYWEWDNLFVIAERINKRKGAREVDDILKPDLPGYDPMVLLGYDVEAHVFYPHPGIEDESLKKRIEGMISVLQLNYDFVRRERRKFLNKVFEFDEVGFPTEIDRFFTAYEMTLAAAKEGE